MIINLTATELQRLRAPRELDLSLQVCKFYLSQLFSLTILDKCESKILIIETM